MARVVAEFPVHRALQVHGRYRVCARESGMTTALSALGTEQFVRLTTFRKTHEPVKTPVWIVPVAGRLLITTAGTSGKAASGTPDGHCRRMPRGAARGAQPPSCTPRCTRKGRASMAVPSTLTSKCRWQPVEAPVLPTLEMTCPAITASPTRTTVWPSARCA